MVAGSLGRLFFGRKAPLVAARIRPGLANLATDTLTTAEGITRALRNDGVLEPDFPKELAKPANRR